MSEAFAILKTDSPFHGLFPGGKAPILPFGPEQADLEGSPEKIVYMLDVGRCTPGQIEEIAEAVAKVRGETPAEVKDFLMTERRLPIRASQVESTESTGISLRMVV